MFVFDIIPFLLTTTPPSTNAVLQYLTHTLSVFLSLSHTHTFLYSSFSAYIPVLLWSHESYVGNYIF